MGKHHERVECNCTQCGRVFMKAPSVVGKKNYCSDDCKRAARTVNCDVCGKEIIMPASYRKLTNYCSDDCKKNARNNTKCDYCGKMFCARWKNKNNYCSDECKINAGLNCTCEYCGKRFKRKKEKIKAHTFCSIECFVKSVNKSEKVSCPNCGIEFYTDRARKKFCSNRCCGLFYGRIIRETHREEKEYKKERARVRALYAELRKAYKETKKKYDELMRLERCDWCGALFRRGLKKKYCSDVCSTRAANAKKEKRIYRNGEPDLSISLAKLYKRDNGVCALCGEKTDYNSDSNSDAYPSIDHIVPLCLGGLHRWDNVQLAHRACNTFKGGKLMMYAPSTTIGANSK